MITAKTAAYTITTAHMVAVMRLVIAFTNSAGGGETSGLTRCWRWMLWLKMLPIIPPAQIGSASVNRIDHAYQPATANCSGFVHDVGSRWGGPTACGVATIAPTGVHAAPSHLNLPSGDRADLHACPSQ